MSNPRVYLCGPITGLTFEEAITWRNNVTRMLGRNFECYSPMRKKENLKHEGVLEGEYRQDILCRAETIVMRDYTDVERADALIVYNPPGYKMSIGTPFEMGMAYMLRKPMILVLDPADSLRGHPFIMRLPKSVIVETLDEACKVVSSLFNY